MSRSKDTLNNIVRFDSYSKLDMIKVILCLEEQVTKLTDELKKKDKVINKTRFELDVFGGDLILMGAPRKVLAMLKNVIKELEGKKE